MSVFVISIPYSSIKRRKAKAPFSMLFLFQFHIVRLKDEYTFKKVAKQGISIPYSSIKRSRITLTSFPNVISIPYSSIKRVKKPTAASLAFCISIPYSSIKSKRTRCLSPPASPFQFHIVRLKGHAALPRRTCQRHFNSI